MCSAYMYIIQMYDRYMWDMKICTPENVMYNEGIALTCNSMANDLRVYLLSRATLNHVMSQQLDLFVSDVH